MLKYNNLKNTKSIILFTSESCNLQCSYCTIANNLNKKLHAEEAKKVKESLVNGQYLNNLKKASERLEIDPNQIEHFELWGQEPTLTLKEFNVMFPELFKYCPNLTSSMFSTNGVGFINDIINYIILVRDTVPHKFRINLQFSYDGDYNTKNSRGINPDIILNNITLFIQEINKIDLQHITVGVNFHNVIDSNIINYYAVRERSDELYKFLKNFSDLSERFITLCTNPNVILNPFTPGLVNPYNASVEEGKNLAEFYKNCWEIGKDIQHKNWPGLTHQFYRRFVDLQFQDVYPFLEKAVVSNHVDFEILKTLSSAISCGFNYGVLKMRYDGTLVLCHIFMTGLSEKELEGKTDADALIQKRRLQKSFSPNIITDSDEIINNYLYQVKLFHEESYLESFNQIINLMITLLKAKQIDQSYWDSNKMLRTAYYLSIIINCPYNALTYSGSLYGHYAGYIRFFCNGFLDLIERDAESYLN